MAIPDYSILSFTIGILVGLYHEEIGWFIQRKISAYKRRLRDRRIKRDHYTITDLATLEKHPTCATCFQLKKTEITSRDFSIDEDGNMIPDTYIEFFCEEFDTAVDPDCDYCSRHHE